jgi:hypothetical protein
LFHLYSSSIPCTLSSPSQSSSPRLLLPDPQTLIPLCKYSWEVYTTFTRGTTDPNTLTPYSVCRYCEDVYTTKRRPTRTVYAGDVKIGSEHPIALQTMTTSMTTDVEVPLALNPKSTLSPKP